VGGIQEKNSRAKRPERTNCSKNNIKETLALDKAKGLEKISLNNHGMLKGGQERRGKEFFHPRLNLPRRTWIEYVPKKRR
jgi:hypothetical protein